LPVNLILAPAASGKTQACLQRIQSLRQDEPLAPIWVLVPDAQNIAYFRQRLIRTGGGMGIKIGTFRALYTDLLERPGHFTPVITSAMEYRMVQLVVKAAYTAGELNHYAAIKNKPGFISVLQNVFSELRSAYISAEQFLDYTDSAPPSKRELAFLYARFLTQLEAIGWIDTDGQIWEAIAALRCNSRAATHIRLLLVDGFTAFAGARLAFLKQLSGQVGEMLITLPGTQDSTRTIHRRTQTVIKSLMHELSPQVTEISAAPHLPAEIRHLEQHVLDPGNNKKFSTSNPIFIEVQSQGEEAREALRWIKRLHKRNGVLLSDCALFVSNLKTYRPYLQTAADEFGIRICFSHPDSLDKSPAVQSLLNLLDLPFEDYKTRSVFNALHSPYFDFGLSAKDINHLELVSQFARIVNGRDQWEEGWQICSGIHHNIEEDLDDERRKKNPFTTVDLPALRQQFEGFWQIFTEIQTHRTQTDWIDWLEVTLLNLRFFDLLSGERDLETWQALNDTLGTLVLSEQILGSEQVDFERFLAILKNAIHGRRIPEPREARHNSVFISEIQHAVASRYKAVALLGFSEGLFPVVEHPDPFLDEKTRSDLGLDPRIGREQASIFYQAFTRTNQYLLLTRPYLAEHGESWDASPYWIASTSLISDNSKIRINPSRSRSQEEAASQQELLFWAVQQNTLNYQDSELQSAWQNLNHARIVLNARRTKTPHSPYEGDLGSEAHIFTETFSPKYTWSSSRFETYATCPHQFFIQQLLILEAKEPPDLGLDAAQVGRILHEILEKVYRQAEPTMNLDTLFEILEENAASVFALAPNKEGFRPSPLWEVEKSQYINMLRKTIEAFYTERNNWYPIRFEEKFGIHNTPLLVLHLESEDISMRGLIDRIDQNEVGELRVIDYKTGGSFLTNKDLISGRRLQMPIYALAAETALNLGSVKEGFYWIIRNAKESSFKLSTFKKGDSKGPLAAYSVALDLMNKILTSIRAGQFVPVAPQGGCPSYCPAIQWCWRYQPGY